MSEYVFWKNEETGQIMVEVFNDERIGDVQRALTQQGYMIIEICRGCFGRSCFMKVCKESEEDWR